MTDVAERRALCLLKTSFLVGAIADFLVGINWTLIAAGWRMPNVMSAYTGTGVDYQFAMYISAMFMFGWAALLLWGFLKPVERRGLLLLTSFLLLVSIMVELRWFSSRLGELSFFFPYVRRLLLASLFTFSYFYGSRTLQLASSERCRDEAA